ncbi:LamG domain-containing protein [Aeromonas salmonicida]|uniref:phage head spike fiber domain-containing protein n=1 Tax=Aeromonas salmonicida TaxID=645 RepID=UPI00259EDB46|nr:LamG-like jellyroll fold domain-containing protein [Aeromonas salmonicida]MDM5067320.1 LamG domain-containing protein [Aeromonas salmonicida]
MAATDKDPSAAIQLVEQTVNTFNQILVGTEGQFVPVPGYPDQPTLAERVKQNLSPSTVEAKAAAEAAKNYRDQAAQISGLTTVAEAVSQAVLPHPDVWLPLNEDIKLRAGFGREVKIGSDIVAMYAACERASSATYFDKSGSLKTAGINEPRIEARGLLCEGARTNTIPTSAIALAPTTGVTHYRVIISDTGKKFADGRMWPKVCQDTSTDTHSITGLGNFGSTGDKYVCASVFVEFAELDSIQLWVRDHTAVGNFASITLKKDGTYTLSTGGSVSDAQCGVIKTPAGIRPWVSCKMVNPGQVRNQIYPKDSWSTAGDGISGIYVTELQLEEGPTPSSLIQTTGTASTRAADYPYLQRAGNDNYFGPITIAAEVSCNGRGVPGTVTDARRGIFSGYPFSNVYEILMIDPLSARVGWAYGGSSFSGGVVPASIEDGNRHVVVAQCDGAKNRLYVDGVKGSVEQDVIASVGPDNGTGKDKLHLGYGAGGTSVRHLWGHIRNLRIWHRAISEAQIKGIA